MKQGIELPQLSKAELTPAVVKLQEIAQKLADRVQLQDEEIQRLKRRRGSGLEKKPISGYNLLRDTTRKNRVRRCALSPHLPRRPEGGHL